MNPTKRVAAGKQAVDCQLVLESLLRHLPGHVYWKNTDGIYLGCNDRQAQSLGLTLGREVIGKTDFELPWQAELAAHFWENDRQVLVSGLSKTVEEMAVIDGKAAMVWSIKVPLKTDQGQMVGVLGISIDITAQKKAEAKLIQAKENVEAAYLTKTRFLENLRHDIRTPISGMRGCIQLLQDCLEEKNPEIKQAKEYLQDVDSSSSELLSLLNKVTMSTQAMDGVSALKKQRVNLKCQLLSLLKLNQARAKEKGLKLALKYDESIPLLIGDGERIEQILVELMSNALNFTDKGGITLTAQLAKQAGERVIIKMMVQDTGIGMTLEKQQALFTRLPHLSAAYSGLSRGTGLGLALIKQIIDELEGEIYVDSCPKKGTTYTCILPLQVALLNEQELQLNKKAGNTISLTMAAKAQPFSSPKASAIRVLLVEDDLIARKVSAVLLTKLGCQVSLAETVASALEKIKSESYELVFMDIGLPDGSGIEVARVARRNKASQNQATPIIAVSAHVDEAGKAACHLAGMDIVLAKPLSEEKVRAILALFVRK